MQNACPVMSSCYYDEALGDVDNGESSSVSFKPVRLE